MNPSIKRIERYLLNAIPVPGWRFWHEYHQQRARLPLNLMSATDDRLESGETVSMAEFDFQIVYKS